MASPTERAGRPRAGLGAGAAVVLLAVCCGGHLVVLGALGGLAAGRGLGIGAGVGTVVAVGAAVLVTRRRRAATCEVKADRRSAT